MIVIDISMLLRRFYIILNVIYQTAPFYRKDFPMQKTGSASILIVNRVRRGTRPGQPEARARVLTIVMQIGSSVSAGRD